MKIIFASDSFKGSLSSTEVSEIEIQAAKEVLGQGDYLSIEMADGGEGTLAAIENSAEGYQRKTASIKGPLGESREADYLLRGKEAVIEMAEASGLPLVPVELRNPMNTTTYGTGQLIKAAIEDGARKIYIGIGGSATNDGGIGAMTALGYKFIMKDNMPAEGYGRDLLEIEKIDDSDIIPEIKECQFTVMCDVKNPLTGPNGATYIFGPQKGAVGHIKEQLEEGMIRYQKILEEYTGESLANVPGLGAAGGLGAALYVILKAELKSGVDVILDLADFDAKLENAMAVISGEGKTDKQTLNGKVVYGIAKRCKEKGVPLHVISGCLGDGIEELIRIGVTTMTPCVSKDVPAEVAMANAEDNLYNAAVRLFKTL